MRKIGALSFLLTTLCTSLVWAQAAGNDGGGGGGICVNGKCMTLAEAGLQIDRTEPTGLLKVPMPALPAETYALYTSTAVNFRDHYLDDFDVESSQYFIKNYQRVKVYDPAALAKVRDLYFEVLKTSKFPTENFRLFAISNASTTYLLPEFFSLNTQSQMLIVFHEEMMKSYLRRSSSSSETVTTPAEALKIILAYDDGVLKLVNRDFSGVYAIARAFVTFQNRSNSAYLKAMILSQSGGLRFIPIDTRTKGYLFSYYGGKVGTLPQANSQLSYEEIDFWMFFNKTYPNLSRLLQSIQAIGTYSYIFNSNGDVDLRKQLFDEICKTRGNGVFLTSIRGSVSYDITLVDYRSDELIRRNTVLYGECELATENLPGGIKSLGVFEILQGEPPNYRYSTR